MAKLVVFWKSNCRPLLRQYLPDVSLEGRRSGAAVRSAEDQESLLGELKTATATSGSKQAAANHLQTFLRQHRIDQYVLVPELSLTPTRGIDRCREVCHVLRPLVYVILLYWGSSSGRDGDDSPIRWGAWGLTFLMDVFSEWPQIVALLPGVAPRGAMDAARPSLSPMQREERQTRLLKMLLYLLREPLYSTVSKGYLDSVIESLSKWRLLRPAMGKDDDAGEYTGPCSNHCLCRYRKELSALV